MVSVSTPLLCIQNTHTKAPNKIHEEFTKDPNKSTETFTTGNSPKARPKWAEAMAVAAGADAAGAKKDVAAAGPVVPEAAAAAGSSDEERQLWEKFARRQEALARSDQVEEVPLELRGGRTLHLYSWTSFTSRV